MMAFEQPELSPRERATRFADTNSYYVSESSVNRLLKAHDLIGSPAFIVIKAVRRVQGQDDALTILRNLPSFPVPFIWFPVPFKQRKVCSEQRDQSLIIGCPSELAALATRRETLRTSPAVRIRHRTIAAARWRRMGGFVLRRGGVPGWH